MLPLPSITPYAPPEDNETLEAALARNVRDALQEDLGRGDWTAQLVPAGRRVRARVVAKEAAVLCGQAWFSHCLWALDATARLSWPVAEGGPVAEGSLVCEIEADARALLSAERSALNFLQLLSATATTTRRYVEAIARQATTALQAADVRQTLQQAGFTVVGSGRAEAQRMVQAETQRWAGIVKAAGFKAD